MTTGHWPALFRKKDDTKLISVMAKALSEAVIPNSGIKVGTYGAVGIKVEFGGK